MDSTRYVQDKLWQSMQTTGKARRYRTSSNKLTNFCDFCEQEKSIKGTSRYWNKKPATNYTAEKEMSNYSCTKLHSEEKKLFSYKLHSVERNELSCRYKLHSETTRAKPWSNKLWFYYVPTYCTSSGDNWRDKKATISFIELHKLMEALLHVHCISFIPCICLRTQN